jgi:hypothetical protein
MRTLMFGECAVERTFALRDPNFPSEPEFEYLAAKAITCAYPHYRCVMFGGTFVFEGRGSRPDLALVANDFSHWFVIEVELITHSLALHVLPQLRTFRYGVPQADCAPTLARRLDISLSRAQTLVQHVPRSVAAIANKRNLEWQMAFRALDVQMLVVSVYDSSQGEMAFEIEGALERSLENVGFGEYLATDRSIKFHRGTSLPLGRVQVADSDGAPSWWIISEAPEAIWMTKETGSLDVENGDFVQMIRTGQGRLVIRRLATR